MAVSDSTCLVLVFSLQLTEINYVMFGAKVVSGSILIYVCYTKHFELFSVITLDPWSQKLNRGISQFQG